MYGEIVSPGETYCEVFKSGVPIPIDNIKDEKFCMPTIRKYSRYNIDIPGNVEDVNPMKFEANLTPIEEFRYTSITPISEKEITEHKKKIEDFKRKKEFFEVDKKRLYFYLKGLLFFAIIYKCIIFFSSNSEKVNYEVERRRFRRYRYREDDDFY